MEGRRTAMVLIGVTALVLGTFVATSYAQMISRTSQNYNGQMMGNNGGMGMNGSGYMGDMGGMMGSMGSHCQGSGSGTGTYSGANMVAISNYSFGPQTLRVGAGTTVTWMNMDTVAHSVVSGTAQQPTGLFESSLLNQGQSFSYTFNTAGTYTYHCGPHPYMTGTIVVE